MARMSLAMISSLGMILLALILPQATATFITGDIKADTERMCYGSDQIITYKIGLNNCYWGVRYADLCITLPGGVTVLPNDVNGVGYPVQGGDCSVAGNKVTCHNVGVSGKQNFWSCFRYEMYMKVKADKLPAGSLPYFTFMGVQEGWFTTPSISCGLTVTECGNNCPRFPEGNPCTDCNDDSRVIHGSFLPSVWYFDYCKVSCRKDCCSKCKHTPNCVYYTYDRTCGDCKLYTGAACDNSGFSSCNSDRVVTGGRCNPQCENDPHFIGAHGVKYDFNGVPDETFCLVTDGNLHINMRLTGYYANETLRSWIRELAFLWRVDDVKHTLQIAARTGKDNERGDGYVESITFDGVDLPRMQPKGRFSDEASGLTLTMRPVTKRGEYAVENYRLSIVGLLDTNIQVRAAHKLLQLPEDAEVHLNLKIAKIEYSEDVHGVLGQTYRNDRDDRTQKFQKIVDSLKEPIHADGATGKGFLDGEMLDYQTHGVLSTDCSFDRFHATDAANDDSVEVIHL